MDIIKAPQKNVETYLYNEFNIEIYEDLTEDKGWKNLFPPLEFFNFLYGEFYYFQNNLMRYLDIKSRFGKLKLTGEKRYYFLWAFNELLDKYFPSESNENNEGIQFKSLEYISELYRKSENEIFPNKNTEIYNEIEKYDFDNVKKHLKTLPTAKEKIKYLIEIKTDYTQENGEPITWVGEQSFADLCRLEIKKLKDIAELEKSHGQIKNINDPATTFKLKDSVISKIDFIRIVNAMCELRAFETDNGTYPTKKEVMQAFGIIAGIDLSDYSKDLSKAFTTNVKMEKNLEIFEKLKNKTQEIFLSKLNKPKK